MKKLFFATAAAVALGAAAPAVAADLPARAPVYSKAPAIVTPAYDWSGFYVGINGGGGFSHKCWDDIDTGIAVSEGCHDASGGTFGGQIGYRWQSAAWVFGLEAQGNWADFRGDNISTIFTTSENQSRINALGLFTGQVGYAWNNALVYVKGGAAVADDRFRVFDVPTGLLTDSASDTRWGAVVGVGFEYGITQNLSLGFEYDHMFMGTRDVAFFDFTGAFDFNERIHQDVDMFTARLNYKFGGPVVARY
ncbi:MAG TPA: outer membrane beta-barrel protein [Bradyrhizobium sp.]|nr:outer membrane beta-barrel protein [Bradyrhizobium sp.]